MHRLTRLAAVTLLASPLLCQADMLGVTFNGQVYDLNSVTGEATLLQSSGPRFNSLARQGDTYWSVVALGGQLSTINEATGAATVGPALSGLSDEVSIRGLAFAAGALYGVQNNGGTTAIGPDSLVRIDTATGATSVVGRMGFSAVQGLAIDASGKAFAWDGDFGLLSVDLATGAASDIGAAGGTFEIQTLAFAPDGRLFGGRESLFRIDTGTGETSFVVDFSGKGFNGDIRGFEFTTAVPEPSTWALLAAGLAFVSGAASRRRAAV
jgi:hypothetical protein